jgi:Skp family chaperone for outer membrane proteins
VLHEELDRLPERYRAPIVLCYLESLTHEQAAQRLQWPVGTVRSRLARGREQLRGRLARRGLAFSAGLVQQELFAATATAAFPTALASVTAEAAVRCATGRFVTTGATTSSVAFLVEGAMHAMFVTKLKFAVLTFGLIAGAVVAAQQVGTAPEARVRLVQVAASEGQAGRTDASAPGGAPDDDAAVARELDRLDLELLAEEVQQLRAQVEVTLREKLRAERRNSGATGEDLGAQPKAVQEARSAYGTARAAYLAGARELKSRQRRLATAEEPRQAGRERSRGSTLPSERPLEDQQSARSDSHPSAAAIGSIDMDAVFKRYVKVKVANKEFNAAMLARKNDLMKIMSEAQLEAELMNKFTPGSEDYKRHENKVTELKAKHEAGRESTEREFSQRQAESMASLYKEIQAMVARIAQRRHLNYVVKVSHGPYSEPNDVLAAINRSVVYADPRDDLTEEVIRDLNRRYQAGGADCGTAAPAS